MIKREGRNFLSKRLLMLADMVTPGNRLVDVGCDHGFLPVYLVREGICPEAIAMDVREGPLEAAKRHVEEFGLGDYIEVRLSDGLAEYRSGEADTMVCAGLGGRLMERILRDDLDKAKQLRELILQPQSELPQFRAFLEDTGFVVTDEDAVLEDGKYYFSMKAYYSQYSEKIPEETEETPERTGRYDCFGKLLLGRRHPVLFQYLRQRECCVSELAAALETASTERGRLRAEQVKGELAMIREALSFFEREG